MWLARSGILFLFPFAAHADRLDPLPAVTDYTINGTAGTLSVGAEYLAHSLSGSGATFVSDDYLVVEVGIYPPRSGSYSVQAGNFTLRINGKTTLLAQAPGKVAASFKYDSWGQRPAFVGTAGVGGGEVIVGRPRQQARFPGDSRDPYSRPATLPRVPTAAANVEKKAVLPEQVAVDCALEEGPATAARRGYLYFPWKGKLKALRTVELLYVSADGALTLKLF
jgi:hypothetical protein